ncbi:GNAT family N-acetyltransferase [Longispora sp. K20-0274]|uniref:GNAT family N-acetyltransferase n=1 Tax=Longispora sp. K20-0274 TaxID=3088255 RepID=UPI00399BF175
MTVELRPLTRADFPALLRWLRADHVRAWWRDVPDSPAAVERKYGPRVDGAAPTRVFVMEDDGTPVGFLQCYRHADYPDEERAVGLPGAAGIDYLVGEPDRTGRGVGSAAIAAFVPVVLGLFPEVEQVVAVPVAANRASCRALERAGFTLVDVREVEPGAGPGAIYARQR